MQGSVCWYCCSLEYSKGPRLYNIDFLGCELKKPSVQLSPKPLPAPFTVPKAFRSLDAAICHGRMNFVAWSRKGKVTNVCVYVYMIFTNNQEAVAYSWNPNKIGMTKLPIRVSLYTNIFCKPDIWIFLGISHDC